MKTSCAALGPAELAEFTAHLRPLVEAGLGEDREAVAYLTARGSVLVAAD